MIDVRISRSTGGLLHSSVIILGRYRANSNYRFTDEYLEKKIEYLINHESIHIVLYQMFDGDGTMVSWLFDVIEYQTHAIEDCEIPLEFLYDFRNCLSKCTRKKYGHIKDLQSTHKYWIRYYRKERLNRSIGL